MGVYDDIIQGLKTAIRMEKEKCMYDKKYKLEKIERRGAANPVYDDIDGRICYLAYLKAGERGWFLCDLGEYDGQVPHRVHTSVIQFVAYEEKRVIVQTENTTYTFRLEES